MTWPYEIRATIFVCATAVRFASGGRRPVADWCFLELGPIETTSPGTGVPTGVNKTVPIFSATSSDFGEVTALDVQCGFSSRCAPNNESENCVPSRLAQSHCSRKPSLVHNLLIRNAGLFGNTKRPRDCSRGLSWLPTSIPKDQWFLLRQRGSSSRRC